MGVGRTIKHIGIFCLLASGVAYPEERAVQAILPMHRDKLAKKPDSDERTLYEKHLQGSDAALVPGVTVINPDPKLALFGPASGHAKLECASRRLFASSVIRGRIDHIARSYLANREDRPHTARLYQKTEQIKDYPISLSQEPGFKNEIRVGYDVISDSSKLEWNSSIAVLGVYHFRASDLMGQIQPDTSAFGVFQAGVNAHPDLPAASISMPWTRLTVRAALSRQLTRMIWAEVSTTQPVNVVPLPKSYDIRFAISF